MFTAAKVGLDWYTVQTPTGRVNYVGARAGSNLRTTIDSAGNVFLTQAQSTTAIYLVTIPANGSAAFGQVITGTTRASLTTCVNETATGGRTYVSVGTVAISANTNNEILQVLGTTNLASGVQGVFYGTSSTIYWTAMYGAYVDTTSSLEIYMGVVVTSGTKFIMSGTSNPTTTAIVPTTMRSIAYSGTSFAINRMKYDTVNSYVLMAGYSIVSSTTSATLIVGSGSGYGTLKSIGFSESTTINYFFNTVAVDKNNSSYVICVGYTYEPGTLKTRPFIAKINASAGTMTSVWTKVISGTAGFSGAILQAVDTDSSGNVYVVGFTANSNMSVIKFDSSGNLVWGRSFGGGASTVTSLSVVGTTIHIVFTYGTNTIVYQMPTDGTYSNVMIAGNRIVVNPETYSFDTPTITVTNPTFTSATLTPTNQAIVPTRTYSTSNPTSNTVQTY